MMMLMTLMSDLQKTNSNYKKRLLKKVYNVYI